jgi:putative membrane protein
LIVRDKPSAWQLLFIMRGSIVPAIAPRLAFVTVLSILIVVLQDVGLLHLHEIATVPFSLIGIALSIFAGFRNSACYDRWWEGRKIFGQLLVETRSLARQQLAYVGPGGRARRSALRCVAFAHLLRDHVREDHPGPEALAVLDAEDALAVSRARNPPNILLGRMTQDIVSWGAAGLVSAQAMQTLEERIVSLSGVLAGAERIKGVLVPYTYSLMLHRTAYMFCLLLPFGLGSTLGVWTPVVVAIVSYTFFGLDALGDELEMPFGTGQNALPLSAMTLGVEIDIREMLGEVDLPDAARPVDFVLR